MAAFSYHRTQLPCRQTPIDSYSVCFDPRVTDGVADHMPEHAGESRDASSSRGSNSLHFEVHGELRNWHAVELILGRAGTGTLRVLGAA